MSETIETLAVGETKEFTTTWTVTEADILAGKILNSVTATGDDIPDPKDDDPKTPEGGDETENDTEDINTTLTVLKTVDKTENVGIGDVLTYTITLTNDGNIAVNETLNGIVFSSCDKPYTGTEGNIVVTDLAVGETATLKYTYTVTEADTAIGKVHNAVTAKGTSDASTPDDPSHDPEGSAETDTPIASHTITVHYVYKDGTKAHDDFVGSYYKGDTYDIVSPKITGYSCSNDEIIAVMGDEAEEVTVVYSPNSYKVTITYKYADGTTAAKTYTATLETGKSYKVTSPTIDGYTASRRTVSGTVTGASINVTVIYAPEEIVIDDYGTALNIGAVTLNQGDCIE